MEPNIYWRVGAGTCSFWWDDWQGEGPLAYSSTASHRLDNRKLQDFIQNGVWDETKLRKTVTSRLLPKIINSRIQISGEQHDQAVWKASDSGRFTLKSAWELIRKKKARTMTSSYTWHRLIPFKMSFLLWRVLRGKLPTNDGITIFGKEPQNCVCCTTPGEDNIEHIFGTGKLAACTWEFFARLFGQRFNNTSLRYQLMSWWLNQARSEVQKLIYRTLPIVIVWNLWKNRCSAKYGGKVSNITKVKLKIYRDIINILNTAYPYIQWPSEWKQLGNMIDTCVHEMKVTKVIWMRPPQQVLKLNTDGSSMGKPGRIGGGGILRDHHGKMIYAYSVPLGQGTSNEAELQASIFGIKWCIQNDIKQIILEVDSDLVTKWINKKSTPPWKLQQLVTDIKNLINQLQAFHCQHIYREGNNTADNLSKYAQTLDTTQQFYAYNQLPSKIKGSYRMEKLGMANFRRRKIKKIKKPP